jgi:hypothetical protein
VGEAGYDNELRLKCRDQFQRACFREQADLPDRNPAVPGQLDDVVVEIRPDDRQIGRPGRRRFEAAGERLGTCPVAGYDHRANFGPGFE